MTQKTIIAILLKSIFTSMRHSLSIEPVPRYWLKSKRFVFSFNFQFSGQISFIEIRKVWKSETGKGVYVKFGLKATKKYDEVKKYNSDTMVVTMAYRVWVP